MTLMNVSFVFKEMISFKLSFENMIEFINNFKSFKHLNVCDNFFVKIKISVN